MKADDGDKVMPLNIQMEMGVDYSVSNAESSILYTEPSDIFQQLSALEGGEDLGWEVGSDDSDDIDWMDYNADDWTCTWDSVEGEHYNCENVNGWDDWWYYCEYYSDNNEYQCTDDFDQNDEWEDSLSWTHYDDGTSPNMGEQAYPHSGDFSTSTGFNFQLTGLILKSLASLQVNGTFQVVILKQILAHSQMKNIVVRWELTCSKELR